MEKISFGRVEEKLATPQKKKRGGAHNYGMEIAGQIWEWTGKTDSFPFWCRIVKNFTVERVVEQFRYMEEKGIRNGRYLLKALRKKV